MDLDEHCWWLFYFNELDMTWKVHKPNNFESQSSQELNFANIRMS